MTKEQLKILHDRYDAHELVGRCFCKTCRSLVGHRILYAKDLQAMTNQELLENAELISGVSTLQVLENLFRRMEKEPISDNLLMLLNKCIGDREVDYYMGEYLSPTLEKISLKNYPNLIPFKVKARGVRGVREYNMNSYLTIKRIIYRKFGSYEKYYVYSKLDNNRYTGNKIPPSAANLAVDVIGDMLLIPAGENCKLNDYELKYAKFSNKDKVIFKNKSEIEVLETQKVEIPRYSPGVLYIGSYRAKQI